jgi:streptogramin lyase
MRLHNYRLFLLLSTTLFLQDASAQFYITTVAGSSNTTPGDNLPAICSYLPLPTGVCVDQTGNLYITSTNSIRRVDAATNIITTFAGSTSYGYSGDGGPATSALMMFPFDICMDPSGNIYVTEYSGERIRKITTAGIISTIACTGTE